jgi:hypothetical protein
MASFEVLLLLLSLCCVHTVRLLPFDRKKKKVLLLPFIKLTLPDTALVVEVRKEFLPSIHP